MTDRKVVDVETCYAAFGIAWYWIVDPEARRATLVAGDDEVKRTRPIPQGWTIEGDPPPNLTTRFEPQGSKVLYSE